MQRRSFLAALAGGALALLGFGAEQKKSWTPKPGDSVQVIDYPDRNMLRACGRGVVTGPVENPAVMNQHYRPQEQLWAVDTGMFKLQCYANELRPRVA